MSCVAGHFFLRESSIICRGRDWEGGKHVKREIAILSVELRGGMREILLSKVDLDTKDRHLS